MKSVGRSLAAIAIAALGITSALADSPVRFVWRGTGGWGDKNAYCSLFDPNNVETLKGTIVSIQEVVPLPGMSPGIEIQLKTKNETLPIHLGPKWYLENQDIQLNPGDEVVVKGSRLVCNGVRAMAATEVVDGDQILLLRNAKGIPLWSTTARQK